MKTPEGSNRNRLAESLSKAALVLAFLVFCAAVHAQLQAPDAPAGNPLTPAKANLGKVLFWDEQVSSTRTVACGTCHFPESGGSDPRSGINTQSAHPGPDGVFGGDDDIRGSLGVPLNNADGSYDLSNHFGLIEQVTRRRATSSINAGYSPELFWDGRALTQFRDPVTLQVVLNAGGALESQAVGPPVSQEEMGNVGRAWLDVLDRISESRPLALSPDVPRTLLAWIDGRSYGELFQEAFGTPEITASRVAMAIASYERTQFTDGSPFDTFLATSTGLTAQELAGRSVFAGAGRCDNCHQDAIMSDHQYHYNGVRPKSDDQGRMEVTGIPADEGKMRTPGLRNIELRAPYMHNGRFATLEEVVEFYDRGGDFPTTEIISLNLTAQQKADLLAFLRRPLTDPRLAARQAPFDRPTLYTESSRVPVVTGTGLPGSGGLEPKVVALEPPMIGNPSFTVGVWNALGGASARLVIDNHDPGLTLPASGSFAFENITLQGVGNGAGFGSASLTVPSVPVSQEWFGRWYVSDTGGGGSVAVSPVFRFRVFRGLDDNDVFADGFESGNTSAWTVSVP